MAIRKCLAKILPSKKSPPSDPELERLSETQLTESPISGAPSDSTQHQPQSTDAGAESKKFQRISSFTAEELIKHIKIQLACVKKLHPGLQELLDASKNKAPAQNGGNLSYNLEQKDKNRIDSIVSQARKCIDEMEPQIQTMVAGIERNSLLSSLMRLTLVKHQILQERCTIRSQWLIRMLDEFILYDFDGIAGGVENLDAQKKKLRTINESWRVLLSKAYLSTGISIEVEWRGKDEKKIRKLATFIDMFTSAEVDQRTLYRSCCGSCVESYWLTLDSIKCSWLWEEDHDATGSFASQC